MKKDDNIFVVAVDTVVGGLILFVGFLVMFFGKDWLDYLSMFNNSSYYASNPISVFGLTPWIIIFIGITTVVYGLKRIMHNLS